MSEQWNWRPNKQKNHSLFQCYLTLPANLIFRTEWDLFHLNLLCRSWILRQSVSLGLLTYVKQLSLCQQREQDYPRKGIEKKINQRNHAESSAVHGHGWTNAIQRSTPKPVALKPPQSFVGLGRHLMSMLNKDDTKQLLEIFTFHNDKHYNTHLSLFLSAENSDVFGHDVNTWIAVLLFTTSQPAYRLRTKFNLTLNTYQLTESHHEILNWQHCMTLHKHCCYILITQGLLNSNYAQCYLQTALLCNVQSCVNPLWSSYITFQDLPHMPLSWLAKNNASLSVCGCWEAQYMQGQEAIRMASERLEVQSWAGKTQRTSELAFYLTLPGNSWVIVVLQILSLRRVSIGSFR